MTTPAPPILSTREVTIRFGGHVAVDHVSLDVFPATLKSIIGLIERIKARRDKTILLVEHKIDMVMALSDAIAVLKDGRLIADGTPEAIGENPEVQAAYFGGGVTGAG